MKPRFSIAIGYENPGIITGVLHIDNSHICQLGREPRGTGADTLAGHWIIWQVITISKYYPLRWLALTARWVVVTAAGTL